MSDPSDATADLVIRPRRSAKAHATMIGGLVAAVLALTGIAAWIGYQTGHDAQTETVKTLAAKAEEAHENKSAAVAEAEQEKSSAIARAEAEKSNAIRQAEERARELLATSEKNTDKLIVENRVLREELIYLEADLAKERTGASRLKQTLDGVKTQLDIDKVAYEELKKSLESSSGDLATLRDELNFYRSILSPEGQKAGVQIQDLSLKETEVYNQFQYRVTLIQARQHDTNVRGEVNIEIEGSQGGIGKIVDVAIFGTPPGRADFKYYQHLQGIFDLPEDFAATGLRVIVKSNLSGQPVEQWYPWPQS